MLVAGLAAASPAVAATRTVEVPNKYDGAWIIVATTAQGPCSSSTSYRVQIKDSNASIPGEDVSIVGGVSEGGSVQATITRGSNRVPISGHLDASGGGSGTWRTSEGLIECVGLWSARRSS
jgi:hypothetical protein